ELRAQLLLGGCQRRIVGVGEDFIRIDPDAKTRRLPVEAGLDADRKQCDRVVTVEPPQVGGRVGPYECPDLPLQLGDSRGASPVVARGGDGCTRLFDRHGPMASAGIIVDAWTAT